MVQMLVSVWNVGFSLKWQFQFQTLVSVSKVGAGLGSLRRWRSLGVARPHFAGGFVVGFAQAKKTPGSRQRGGGQRKGRSPATSTDVVDVDNEIYDSGDFYEELEKVTGIDGRVLQNSINMMVEKELWRFPLAVDLAGSSGRTTKPPHLKKERRGKGGKKSSRKSSDGAKQAC